MSKIKEYDLVVLTEDIEVTNKETFKKILLHRGQFGTVIMDFEQEAFLVDFADEEGVTYAMETVAKEQLIPLIDQSIELLAS